MRGGRGSEERLPIHRQRAGGVSLYSPGKRSNMVSTEDSERHNYEAKNVGDSLSIESKDKAQRMKKGKANKKIETEMKPS